MRCIVSTFLFSCAILAATTSCETTGVEAEEFGDAGPRDAALSDLSRGDTATQDRGRADGAGADAASTDAATADLERTDSAREDTARPDSNIPVDGCDVLPDFSPCAEGQGTCIGGLCYRVGSCDDARCNRAGPLVPLADTGQRVCHDVTMAEASCPAPGEDCFGQDAQYGWDTSHTSSERFSRSEGEQPVVQDNVTGLIWQGCMAGQSGSACTLGTAMTVPWTSALAFCDNLSWGGESDWTLPDYYELFSIVDLGVWNPAVDTTIFPASTSVDFWSTSTHATRADNAWCSNLGLGYVYDDPKTEQHHVRCVRARPAASPPRTLERSVPTADEAIVKDSVTDLVWQGCVAGLSGEDCQTGSASALNWPQALAYCEDLGWGGHDDWRLPDGKELQSIVETRRASPAINTTAFPATPAEQFWTSSVSVFYMGGSWEINFEDGNFNGGNPDHAMLVRCVRAGN